MNLKTALVVFLVSLGLSSVENCHFSPILLALAEDRVLNKSFSLEIPAPFERIEVPQASVAAAMRHRLANFPTFNILILPSKRKVLQSPQDSALETLKSYREMGLTSSKIELVGEHMLSSHRAYYTKLQYLLDNEEFKSLVYTVPLQDKDLILTYVDRATNFERDASLLEEILNGFNILEAPKLETKSTEGFFPSLRFLVGLVVVLLSVAFIAFLILKRRIVQTE